MWTVIAVVLDHLLIVRLVNAVYYVLTFLIPVGIGLYLARVPGDGTTIEE